ncbi:MAG: SDR family oxidoreductase [Sphingomonadaceae bacterium]
MSGKVCIVTGGASGIGKATAAALLREGGTVVITDRNEPLGRQTEGELGGACRFAAHDVTSEDQWRGLIADVFARDGRLDVLVNNAGVSTMAGIEDVILEQWRTVQAVNVEGVMLGCKYAIPAMRNSGSGSIINVTSTVVDQPLWFNPAYSASKGAADALTRAVAVYCIQRGYNIRCNSVEPHGADTPLLESTLSELFSDLPPEAREKMRLRLGRPEAVANAILFLASDEASDLTGSALALDRGARITMAAPPD